MKNGYILFQDRLRVVIATGFVDPSENVKTGDMIQIWILRRDLDPISANETGKDKAICGLCPLRGGLGKPRTCYVLLKNAPLSVFNAYKRGSYSKLPDYSLFDGRAVRFGAYGDPTHIPFQIVKTIADRASNWTGYTHQWRNGLFREYRNYLMASCESIVDLEVAHHSGWRTFRVVKEHETPTQSEIVCANESKGIQCVQCGLCKGSAIKARSITITVHGNGKSNFSAVNN